MDGKASEIGRCLFLLVLLGIVQSQITGQTGNNGTVSHEFTSQTINGNKFQVRSITDGILVTGGKETLGHSAVWTVLVTLDIPTVQSELLQKLNAFQQILYTHERISNLTKSIWNQRILDIKSTMTIRSTNRRTRRGLVNIVGLLSNRLFGTATEAQIKETRSQIENIAKQNKRVVNVINELITIVNHTHAHSRIVNQHIQSLETYVSAVAFEIRKSENATRKLRHRIDVLTSATQTDRTLTLIETTHNLWLRQLDRYNRQRAALELGYLTEDILSIEDLTQIIVDAKQHNLHAPNINWYYSYVKIEPLWRNDKILVFRANLPLTDSHMYLRYHIQSWPIPGNSSEFRTQLQVTTDIAFHTETGGIFKPTGCLGNNPAICRTGPIFDRTMMKCSRGILTGEPQLRRHCSVTITKVREMINTVQEISPGAAIISTYGETISLLCTGQAEKRVPLIGGLYFLTIPPNCRINGKGWTLAGLIHRSIRFVMKLPIIKIRPFNLSTTVSHESVAQHLKSPHWMLLDKVENIRLSSLTVEPSDISGIHWNSPANSTLWTTLGIIALISVVIIVGLVLQQLRKRRMGDTKPIVKPHARDPDRDDAIEMTTRSSDTQRRPDVSAMPARQNVMTTELTAGPTTVPPMFPHAAGTSLPPLRHTDEPWGHVNHGI